MKQIGFKCGILYKKDEMIIKRVIFRISRGLSIFQTLEDEGFRKEDATKKDRKIAFYLFFGFGTS